MAGTLWMGDLEQYMDENFIKESFTMMGEPPVSVRVIRNRRTGLTRGFGFVEFGDERRALRAQQNCNGKRMPNDNQSKQFRLEVANGNDHIDDREHHDDIWFPDFALFGNMGRLGPATIQQFNRGLRSLRAALSNGEITAMQFLERAADDLIPLIEPAFEDIEDLDTPSPEPAFEDIEHPDIPSPEPAFEDIEDLATPSLEPAFEDIEHPDIPSPEPAFEEIEHPDTPSPEPDLDRVDSPPIPDQGIEPAILPIGNENGIQEDGRISREERLPVTRSLRPCAMPESAPASDFCCVVCLDKNKSIAFLPCRHLCVCDVCNRSMIRRNMINCPVCRQKIESFINVLFA